MFRSDFSFLEEMFPEGSCWEYPILIINQTDAEHQLVSDHHNVRVINTEERGLPKSRNMAIEKAMGEICLVADDDVRYVRNVRDIVVSAFAKANDATIISFQMLNHAGALYRTYPDSRKHTVKTVDSINGVVIAFNRQKLLKKGVRYDPHFGLGATFQTANEYVFMRNALEANALSLFEPEVILTHPGVSSGQHAGKDSIIYGRGALRFKYMGWLAYLSMIKYAWFYYCRGDIAFLEIPSKIKIAFSGIKRYKQLHPSASSLEDKSSLLL